MNRKLLITLHLYLAAFFAPAVLLVALSGGLYLAGVKGTLDKVPLYSSSDTTIDVDSGSLNAVVAALLADAGVTAYHFETVKVSGTSLYTRPTSSDHYIIELDGNGAEVVRARPSLQYRMIELHKGHGPAAFKTFQKVFAVALVLIILSGLWLGISATRLRSAALLTSTAGAIVFALLLL